MPGRSLTDETEPHLLNKITSLWFGNERESAAMKKRRMPKKVAYIWNRTSPSTIPGNHETGASSSHHFLKSPTHIVHDEDDDQVENGRSDVHYVEGRVALVLPPESGGGADQYAYRIQLIVNYRR